MKPDHDDLVGNADDTASDLKKTLYEHLPEHRTEKGELDTAKIARDMDMSRWGVDLWFKRKNLPPKRFKDLMNLPGSTLTEEVLLPFLFD